MTQYVYISMSGNNKISIFTMDRDSGKLAHKEDADFHDGAGPMALHPSKPMLYAALRSSKELLSFRIDPSTGGLSQEGSVGLEEGPAMISTAVRLGNVRIIDNVFVG